MKRTQWIQRGVLCLAIAAFAAGATADVMAAPPTVITGSASAVSSSTATVSGGINPNGVVTSWYVEYGTTTGYGSNTAVSSVEGTTTTVSVSAVLSDLTPGTRYYYRLVATSSLGMVDGTNGTFVTVPTPVSAPKQGTPLITGVTAFDVNGKTAVLEGALNGNGVATNWYFQYGTSTSYGTNTRLNLDATPTVVLKVEADLTGLDPGTLYHFRLAAESRAGTVYSPDALFTTIGDAGVTASSAQLIGTVNPGGVATSWYFEYGTAFTYSQKTPIESAGSGTVAVPVRATISGLAEKTRYHFRLVTINSTGTHIGGGNLLTTLAGPTLDSYPQAVIYGRSITLRGSIPNGEAHSTVTIRAKAFPSTSFVPVGTVETGSDGAWSAKERPMIGTAYEATWQNETSGEVVVGVAPAVSLRRQSGSRFSVHAEAMTSLEGRAIELQRLASGRWATLASTTLNAGGTAIISADVPKGHSTLRAVLVAGAGYEPGVSRWIS